MMEEESDTGKDDCLKSPNGNISSTIETPDNETHTSSTTASLENNDISPFKVPNLQFQPKHVIVKQHLSEDSDVQNSEENETTVSDLFSPAEKLKDSQTPIPYKEPPWGGLCNVKYSFEVLKNGVIIDNIDLNKSFYVFGRLPSCDVTLEHPSLSRHHAVIQFCATKTEKHDVGWYLYDLDSTHGTWINKHKVYANKYYRLRVGHVLKFGGSTRLFILQGPDGDQEDESEMSVAEMKEQREKQQKEADVLRHAGIAAQEKNIEAIRKKEDSGCSWGMSDDAIDDEDANSFSQEIKLESEELYIDDPKKALKGFYEREGYEEPEYIVTDAGSGKYKCAVELPVDGPNGVPVVAEAIVSGKKKEAVLQCALEGCRILDRMNLLRASTHESRKRKQKNWEDDDFYDSDEDAYLDRTGDIEKKRQQRMQKAGKTEGKTETYKSLVEKHEVILAEIQGIEAKLEKAKSDAAAMETDDLDALDAYMMAIKSGVMDTKTKMALKRQLMALKQDEMKIRKLVNIAKPTSLPELKSPQLVPKSTTQQISITLPIVGKIKSQKPLKRPVVTSRTVKEIKEKEEDFIEEEDEDDDEPPNKYSREDPTSRLQGKQEEDDLTSELKGTQVGTKSSKSQELHKSSQESKNVSLSRLKEKRSEDDSGKPSTENHKQKQKKKDTKQQSSEGRVSGSYNSKDPDYAVWMPPTGQTGDGKTTLNEKYGY